MKEKLYFNGDILTMEENDLYPKAVLVREGKIVGTGDRQALLDRAKTKMVEEVDLKGRTLLPGFIDTHSHFSGYATSLLQVSLKECTNFREIQEAVASFIKEQDVPEGQWVSGSGYDDSLLAEKTHPTREVLDAVSPRHPVVLSNQSNHAGVVNTLALKLLRIDNNTPQPEGGRIEISEGEPTGYLEENAFFACLDQVPMPDQQELLDAYEEVERRYASYGITTIQEGMFPPELIPLYERLLEKKSLYLDVVSYADIHRAEKVLNAFQGHVRVYEDHFKIGGYKTFLDGSPQGRTAWMRTPYKQVSKEDSPDYCGYPAQTDKEVYEAVKKSVRDNMQLLAHCNGDAAAEQYIQAWERFYREGGSCLSCDRTEALNTRPVLIHGQLLGRDQIPRLKKMGITPSFFIAHVYYWGDTHLKNFGEDRARHISPAGSAFKEGLRFTFHQDSPVVRPNMLETIWCAVNRQTKSGVYLNEEGTEDERISVYEALKAVTIHGAWQYHEEQEKGSIRAGKRADFVILDKNPLKTPPEKLKTIQICTTVKDGTVVYGAE